MSGLCCHDNVQEAASMLVWLQESGLARVLLPELGLETIMRIDRPARPGDTLQVCVGFVDVPKGVYKLNEVDFFASASLSSADIDDDDDVEEEQETVDDASSPTSDGVQDSELTDGKAAVVVGELDAELLTTVAPASGQ